MNCTICHHKITLAPSAADRARKFGGTPDHFTRLFTTHAECQLRKNREDVSAWLAQMKGRPTEYAEAGNRE